MANPTPTEISAALGALDRAVRLTARDKLLTTARKRATIRDWSIGGCLVYAEGIRGWLGPEAKLLGVHEQLHGPDLDHVAACWRGLCFDAIGVRDESDFEYDMVTRNAYHIPVFVRLSDPRRVKNISFDATLADAVAKALRSRLDPAPSLAILRRA